MPTNSSSALTEGRRLIYIAGEKHCGSTATALLLGQFVGVCSGELNALGTYVNADGTLDVQKIASKSVGPVWVRLLASSDNDRRLQYRWLTQSLLQEKNIFKCLISRRYRESYARQFDDVLPDFFAASNSKNIVDSSKKMNLAAILSATETVEVTLVHLVRGPLAHLRSRAARQRPYKFGTQVRHLFHWAAKNILGAVVSRFYLNRHFTIRFEALCRDPYATLQPLFHHLCHPISREEFETRMMSPTVMPQMADGGRVRFAQQFQFVAPAADAEAEARIHPVVRAACKVADRFLPV